MRCAISPCLCGVGRFDFAKKQHPFSHEIFELFDGGVAASQTMNLLPEFQP